MDLSALRTNLYKSREIGANCIHSLKFLLWIYGLGSSTRSQSIAFELPPPIGKITVQVRANGGADAFIFGEVFEHRCYDLHLSTAPATILDLGANVGFATIFFARSYPYASIACVEPVPGNVALLRKNLAANAITAAVLDVAVGIANGPVQMQLCKRDYGHKIVESRSSAAPETTITVQSLSVPTLMRQLNWSRIGLLKIDIEGYEALLLRENCQWLHMVDELCIECHDDYGETDLNTIANEYGFLAPRSLAGLWVLSRNKR